MISIEDDPEGLGICSSIAPFFFYDVSRAFIETIIMGFCKITDPAGSGKRTNITTNYILEVLPWPDGIRARLKEFNARLMAFRRKIEPARSKRIAHLDLKAQIQTMENLGKFEPGEDLQFLLDLQSFFDIAYGHLHNGASKPIARPGAADTYKLVTALRKAVSYDEAR